MKTIIFAFHGNPGRPQDWEEVQQRLPRDLFQIIPVDSYSDDTLEQIKKIKGKVIFLAHSWGCFRLLQLLNSFPQLQAKAIFVNPTLKVQSPLSPFAICLLKAPFLGNFLIKKNLQTSGKEFYPRMIAPENIKNFPQALRSQDLLLANTRLWKQAAYAKMQHQSSQTVFPTTLVAGYALVGSADQVISAEKQIDDLKHFPSMKIEVVPQTGHAILWTHPQLIVEKILALQSQLNLEAKVGYQFGEWQENNLLTHMARHLHDHPERVALKWASNKNWSGNHEEPLVHHQIHFRDLAKRIESFANGLHSVGIQKNDRVIIFLPMSLDMYVAMFAVQRLGAIAVFLDSWARSHHLGASAECVEPKAMISFQQAFALVEQVPEFKKMPLRILYGPGDKGTHSFESLLATSAQAPMAAVEPEASALVTFTTGSTGKPKGADRTHRFLSAQHSALNHVIPYTLTDTDMPAFPIFSLNNLAAGVTTVLPALDLANPSPQDSALLACQIIHEKISCTTLSPSMLTGLARYCAEKRILLNSLRRVVTGGAPISKDDVRNFYAIAPQTDIWVLYGSTEAEPMAHIEGRDMLKESKATDSDLVENGVNVGHISEDVRFKFIRIKNGPIDLTKTPWGELEVPQGEVGEFLVTGDHVCQKYYNNQDAFFATKIQDTNGDIWHRTGDLAYLDSHHQLWIVGRTNNAIERNGKYYFPVQAEVILKRFPFVTRAAFLGIPHPTKGAETWIAIEPRGSLSDAEKQAAQKEIHHIFEKNKIPVDEIRFVPSIPMDPRHHSKVEYATLRQQLIQEEKKQ